MIEKLRRVLQMDRTELVYRGRVSAFRAWDRAVYWTGRSRWRRRELARALRPLNTELETARAAIRQSDWRGAHAALARHFASRESGFPIDPKRREELARRIGRRFPHAVADARSRAARIVAGEYDLLGYLGLRFEVEKGVRPYSSHEKGSDPFFDWHWDPVHRRRMPMRCWTDIRYLDPACGDHKIVWELNRHQHWLALGRALWLTGDPRARTTILQQLASWMAANPPLAGANWASALELALRCLSWTWALHFLVGDASLKPGSTDDSPADDSPWLVDLLLGLDRQLTHVERNLSHYFSPNTHLTGEALALYVTGRVLPELAASGRRASKGRRILLQEIDRQILADGGHVERSAHYHRYTLEFYLLALLVARMTGDEVAPAFGAAVARLARFARTLADDEGRVPNLGDDDGGVLLPICGRSPADIRDALGSAAVLLDDPELAAGELPEEVWWLAGRWAPEHVAARVRPGTAARPASAALTDSGYFVSRLRPGDHLVFDSGPHGYLTGGHAHADALAITLTAAGRPVLVDPGTGTYTVDPALRDRLRSSAAHNTLVLDGRSQSEPAGPFTWRRTADARAERWRLNPAFDYFEGSHDGYRPSVHRRAVLTLGDGCWFVADWVSGAGDHRVDLHWHLAAGLGCEIAGVGRVRVAARPPTWIMSPGLDTHGCRGSESGLGWCSPVYGALVPIETIRMTRLGPLPHTFVTAIVQETSQVPPRVSTLPVSEREAGCGCAALRLARAEMTAVAYFALGDVEPRLRTIGGDIQTDARMLHIAFDEAGLPAAISVVDGTFVRRRSAPAFSLDLARRAPDFHLAIEERRAIRAVAAGPTPDFRLDIERVPTPMRNAECGMRKQL